MAGDIDWELFNTAEHQTAQRNCHHLILCAVDGPTRKTVVERLDYARKVGDSNDTVLRIAQLTGPCCLPPTNPNTNPTTGPTAKEDQPSPSGVNPSR
jgi:hypothetical protein